jgi:hypothetical protein
VASTIYAQRNSELKNRYVNNRKSKDPSFETQWNALWHLANMKRLSRHNVIALGKFILEMQEAWTSTEQQEQIEQLRARQERAWRRWEARIAERAEAKLASGGKRSPKKDTPTPTPAAPVPDGIDPWSL